MLQNAQILKISINFKMINFTCGYMTAYQFGGIKSASLNLQSPHVKPLIINHEGGPYENQSNHNFVGNAHGRNDGERSGIG
jgi:hypothetical protein